jgi:hypothetical protein
MQLECIAGARGPGGVAAWGAGQPGGGGGGRRSGSNRPSRTSTVMHSTCISPEGSLFAAARVPRPASERQFGSAADAAVLHPEIAHPAFRTTLLAFGGRREGRLRWRRERAAIPAQDGERGNDSKRGHESDRDQLSLFHVPRPQVAAVATPDATVRQLFADYAQATAAAIGRTTHLRNRRLPRCYDRPT